MKVNFIIIILLAGAFSATSQIPITAIDTSTSLATGSFTYTRGDTTYNWGVSPNDTVISVYGFNAGSNGYVHLNSVQGNVKLRRVNNSVDTGNFTLEWAQTKGNGTIFNMFPAYQKSLDSFLTGNTYNKGTDNLFDNTSPNSNDIERLDWIATDGYSTPVPDQAGVAVFDKGAPGTHDPFCIAAITSIDPSGNPLTYGNIVRIVAANYGDPGPSILYRIVKGQYPADLLNAGINTQNIGGVFITLKALGVTSNTEIFGYSLFSNDLPLDATAANLIDYTNATYFPLNTGAAGGLDLVAVTGLNIATSILLPVSFLNFNAVDNNDKVNLIWSVENETPGEKYDIERSVDGVHFLAINQVKNANNLSSNSYSVIDNVSSVLQAQLYYRIKQYEADGSFHYSKTILIRRNNKTASILVYPNPVQNNLYLNIPSRINDKAIISIFNSGGSRVLEIQESLANGNNSFTIDGLGNLSKDVYQLSIRLINSGTVFTKQFLKQ